MTTAEKIKPGTSVYWVAVGMFLIFMSLFGNPAIEWLLTRLYEFFIQMSLAK